MFNGDLKILGSDTLKVTGGVFNTDVFAKEATEGKTVLTPAEGYKIAEEPVEIGEAEYLQVVADT